MDATTNFDPTRSDSNQRTPSDCPTLGYHHGPDNTVPDQEAVLNNSPASLLDIHPGLMTKDDGIASRPQGHEGQSSIHTTKSDREPSDTLTARDSDGSTTPQSASYQVTRPILEDPSSECTSVPADGSTLVANMNESKADKITHSESLEPLLSLTVFPDTAEAEPEPDEPSNCIQTSLELTHSDGLDRMQEDFDDPCDDTPSSVPPSSSPPQLFSSSPCVSSQSSSSDVEPPKMLAAESEGITSFHGSPHADDMAFYENSSYLESENHNHNITGGLLEPSRQRMTADQSEPDKPYGSPPTKRPKLDPSYSSPPAPKRATVASQNRQFKKLTAPFRPPSLKLPVVIDGPAQTRNRIEPDVRSQNDTRQNKSRTREPTAHPFLLQNKASNTPKSVTQFKSPLVNRILSADTRAVRLTPAVQALERKLQLLKRAVKVKEDKDEEVLVRLSEKWVEAGREVAYDVWDATKGELEGTVTSVRRPHGWGSANDRNVPWGWDIKPEDPGEDSGVPGSSDVPFSAERFAPEEEDADIDRHTLGTMLRQLGIAPEIFGWDDDKEAFSE